MAELMLIFQKIQIKYQNLKSLKDLAIYAWDNLNPRDFNLGVVKGGLFKDDVFVLGGTGRKAHRWQAIEECIKSSELIDFIKMLGASDDEAKEISCHLINQGFYKVRLDLTYVEGSNCEYLLQLNV